jgi:SOS-response transcriptional repressor LexA
MNVKIIRRENLRALATDLGSITALAEFLGKSQSQMSRLIGRHPIKNIGDKLAAEIESAFSKPSGWLDWRHAGIQETLVQERMRAISHSQVPLLASKEVTNWISLSEDELDKRHYQLISAATQTSQYAFAIQINDSSMEATAGISFPKGSIIIADPESVVRDGSYVIVQLEGESEPVFRQCIRDASGTYLKALNSKYPTRKLTSPQALFCGVVRQMIMQVE